MYDADVVGDDFLGQACLPLQKLIDPEEDGLTVTKSLPLAACQTPDAPTKVTDITSDMISGDIQIEMAFSVDRSRLELGSRAQMDAALKDAMEQLHINRTERLDLLQLSDEAKLQMIATVRRRKATASTVRAHVLHLPTISCADSRSTINSMRLRMRLRCVRLGPRRGRNIQEQGIRWRSIQLAASPNDATQTQTTIASTDTGTTGASGCCYDCGVPQTRFFDSTRVA